MELNLPILIVILILFAAITILWGIVNYMKGREQVLLMMLKSIGIDAMKAADQLKQMQKTEKKE